ncbi:MAG: hypothetical protein ABMB14_27260 [Myxococcota bacterium]
MDRSDAVIAAVLWAGCVGAPIPTPPTGYPGAALASEIVSAPGDTGDGFHDARRAVNGVRGGGQTAGSLDVYSIGLADDALILGFDVPVVDRDGPDLAVFENAFAVSGGGWFIDPVVVEVSADCEAFVAFPVDYTGGDGFVADPARWVGFAGITPVLLNDDDHPVDPLGDEAGGDRFDLATLGADAPDELRCVRLTSASAWLDPVTGVPYGHDPVSDGPDIDGVYGAVDAVD